MRKSFRIGVVVLTLLGWKGNPHLNPIHILSNLLIGAGFVHLRHPGATHVGGGA